LFQLFGRIHRKFIAAIYPVPGNRELAWESRGMEESLWEMHSSRVIRGNNDISARQKLKQMLRVYCDTRHTLDQRKDVVQLFMNAQIGSPRELEDVIVSYLRRNNEISRLLKARFGACIAHRSLRSHF
jgi:hypothetical protein